MDDAQLNPVDNVSEPRGTAGAESPLEFECPRCGTAVATTFYGPCGNCRDQLRATMSAVATDVEVGDYEPKMNVTPNAVALKD